MRYYRVFNIEDTTLPIEIREPEKQAPPVVVDACEHLIDQMPGCPRIVSNDVSRCFYSPFLDFINMVPAQNFKQPEEYYSVLFHELSTLNRTQQPIKSRGNHERRRLW